MGKNVIFGIVIAAMLCNGTARAAPGDGALTVCAPDGKAGTGACDVASLSALQGVMREGSVVTLLPGTYRECLRMNRKNVTLQGAGALLLEKVCDGKAAFVVTADNVVLKDVACEGMRVPDKNGACVRLQGGSLTLDNVRFARSEDGFLGGRGDLTVLNSLFENNGKAGYAHQLYFNSPNRLVIRHSRFIGAQDEGHGIKTGARETILDDVTIDGTGGRMSRNIDAFNGGILRITNSRLIKADSDANRTIIGYDYEARVNLTENSITIENTLIDCGRGATILSGRHSVSTATIVFRNNTVRGRCQDIGRFAR